MAELASRYKIHPNMITKWKREALEGMKETFTRGGKASQPDHEVELKELRAKIGELVVERDFGTRLRSMSVERRREMVERDHPQLSLSRQCRLLGISRGNCY